MQPFSYSLSLPFLFVESIKLSRKKRNYYPRFREEMPFKSLGSSMGLSVTNFWKQTFSLTLFNYVYCFWNLTENLSLQFLLGNVCHVKARDRENQF